MSLKVTVEKTKGGILKKNIDVMVKEIRRLQRVYGIEIEELAQYSQEEAEEVDIKNKRMTGSYYHDTKTICVNQFVKFNGEDTVGKMRDAMLEKERELLKYGFFCEMEELFANCNCAVSLIRHEYCHAIIHTFPEILEDEEIKNMFAVAGCGSYRKYALSNIEEFVACAFEMAHTKYGKKQEKRVKEIVDSYALKEENDDEDRQ